MIYEVVIGCVARRLALFIHLLTLLGRADWAQFVPDIVATSSGVFLALFIDSQIKKKKKFETYEKIKLVTFRELDDMRQHVEWLIENTDLTKGTTVEKLEYSALPDFVNNQITHDIMSPDSIANLRLLLTRIKVTNSTLETMHQLWIAGRGDRKENQIEVMEKLNKLHDLLMMAREILGG